MAGPSPRPESGSRHLLSAEVLRVCLGFFLILCGTQAPAQSPKGPDAPVRAAREGFNRAIELRNAPLIGTFLAPAYSVVNGRGDKLTGRDEEVRRWAGRFRADRRLTFRRTPSDVIVNAEWGIAHETGEWSGSFTSAAQTVRTSGVYSARWQRSEGGRWLVDSEIFVTLKCEGPEAGCFKPDPIQ